MHCGPTQPVEAKKLGPRESIVHGKLEDGLNVQPAKVPVWKSPFTTMDAADAVAAQDATKANARRDVRRFKRMESSLVFYFVAKQTGPRHPAAFFAGVF